MPVEISLDLGLALPREQSPGHGQAQDLLAIEVTRADRRRNRPGAPRPGNSQRPPGRHLSVARQDRGHDDRGLFGDRQPQAPEHQDQGDPHIAELSDQFFRQSGSPARLRGMAARPGTATDCRYHTRYARPAAPRVAIRDDRASRARPRRNAAEPALAGSSPRPDPTRRAALTDSEGTVMVWSIPRMGRERRHARHIGPIERSARNPVATADDFAASPR